MEKSDGVVIEDEDGEPIEADASEELF